MYLPEHEQLNIQALTRTFDSMSESYKIFWFNGILKEIKAGHREFTFGDVINHMIASAWFMVSEYHLNLGPSDTLEKLVHSAKALSGLTSNAKASDVVEFIRNSDSSEIREGLRTLTLNVPYRLQSPFMPDLKGKAWNTKGLIDRINAYTNLIYYFRDGSGLDRKIVVSEAWFDYLSKNQSVIEGWINFNLIDYLQRRNPNVPGIVNKLVPPTERKLEGAKKYWKGVVEYTSIRNIYDKNGDILSTSDISIDHFVPWSYVSHDELWNLVPTTRSLNSSKSNNLPNWDTFFPKLCEIEYQAYKAVWDSEVIHKLFENCAKNHLNSDEIRLNLYRNGLEKPEFSERLKDIILPSYVAAKNTGFSEWII